MYICKRCILYNSIVLHGRIWNQVQPQVFWNHLENLLGQYKHQHPKEKRRKRRKLQRPSWRRTKRLRRLQLRQLQKFSRRRTDGRRRMMLGGMNGSVMMRKVWMGSHGQLMMSRHMRVAIAASQGKALGLEKFFDPNLQWHTNVFSAVKPVW